MSQSCSTAYVYEKFTTAVWHMATTDAPLRHRVLGAWDEFHPAFLEYDELPSELASSLRRLCARMKGAEGASVTLMLLSDAEIRRIAFAIHDLAYDARKAFEKATADEAERAERAKPAKKVSHGI